MEYLWVPLVLAALSTVFIVLSRRSVGQRRQQQTELDSQLSASRQAASEDLKRFGEEVHRLRSHITEVPEIDHHPELRQGAEAYAAARRTLAAAHRPEELRHVTEILEEAGYSAACVRARIAGEPLPVRRPPCFFNPAHGQSSMNVTWADSAKPRSVPACAADAERVLAGADPYIRTVSAGARRVPYWDGGRSYEPWAQGYFAAWRGSEFIREMIADRPIFGEETIGGFGSTLIAPEVAAPAPAPAELSNVRQHRRS